MKVQIDELKKIFSLIITHLEENHSKEFEIEHDYYWSIDTDEQYDAFKEPKELTIGQLSEDIEILRKVLAKQQEPIGWHLVPLSSLIRFLGNHYMA